jgi:diaminobutyrate-2-oxoglutarate transaminase
MAQAQLVELQKRYPVIGHVRGLGMMIGIEIVKPNEAADQLGCFPGDGELAMAEAFKAAKGE